MKAFRGIPLSVVRVVVVRLTNWRSAATAPNERVHAVNATEIERGCQQQRPVMPPPHRVQVKATSLTGRGRSTATRGLGSPLQDGSGAQSEVSQSDASPTEVVPNSRRI